MQLNTCTTTEMSSSQPPLQQMCQNQPYLAIPQMMRMVGRKSMRIGRRTAFADENTDLKNATTFPNLAPPTWKEDPEIRTKIDSLPKKNKRLAQAVECAIKRANVAADPAGNHAANYADADVEPEDRHEVVLLAYVDPAGCYSIPSPSLRQPAKKGGQAQVGDQRKHQLICLRPLNLNPMTQPRRLCQQLPR